MDFLATYRSIHSQAFMPIFVRDGYDSRLLVEACVTAGYRCIEYTLRREDAREIVPWTRRNFPRLKVVVGSTVDNDAIVRQQRARRYPGLMTIDEVADMDVHGFVSMIGWRPETIAKWAATHVIMPSAMTVNEAFEQVRAGAHFIKLSGADLSVVKRVREAAAFDYCPVLVTGGVTPERMSEVYEKGAVMTATGFDLMLRDLSPRPALHDVTARLQHYQQSAVAARAAVYPELAAAADAPTPQWLRALPHVHPFADLEAR